MVWVALQRRVSGLTLTALLSIDLKKMRLTKHLENPAVQFCDVIDCLLSCQLSPIKIRDRSQTIVLAVRRE